MQDLQIGVIGSGGRGGLARYAHHPGNGSRVVACCDVDPAVFERNKQQYGSDLYLTADYRELLRRDLDAVFVNGRVNHSQVWLNDGTGRSFEANGPYGTGAWPQNVDVPDDATLANSEQGGHA